MTDTSLARSLLTDMIRIRRMEEKCAEMYSAGKIRGFLHLYVGEEAVAAGSLRVLDDEDAVIATYREHAHALLRGIPMTKIMAEMYGKQEGCSGGRGGSMHLFDAGRRFYGGNAIVAAGMPLAAGLAFADKQLGRNRINACYFGEGATAEGAFHESMNMAELWQLPVLFCCENNRYAMGTAIERELSQVDLVTKAQAYRVPAASADGMDVIACHDAMRQAVDHIRTHGGPFSSSSAPTDSGRTRCSIPSSTGTGPRWTSGASTIPSGHSPSDARPKTCSAPQTSPRSRRPSPLRWPMPSPTPRPARWKASRPSPVT